MAREMPYIAAIGEAIHLEMARDESVLYFGQNIATTDDDPFLSAFGADRVRVTPISETAEIGMAVGAFLWGTIADIAGRKPAFIWTMLIYSVFSILSAAAPNYLLLLGARFITGVGLGGCIPVAYSLVAEFMPRSRRELRRARRISRAVRRRDIDNVSAVDF